MREGKQIIRWRHRPNKSLDASGGSVFRNLRGAAKDALIRAAASTQPLGHSFCCLDYPNAQGDKISRICCVVANRLLVGKLYLRTALCSVS